MDMSKMVNLWFLWRVAYDLKYACNCRQLWLVGQSLGASDWVGRLSCLV